MMHIGSSTAYAAIQITILHFQLQVYTTCNAKRSHDGVTASPAHFGPGLPLLQLLSRGLEHEDGQHVAFFCSFTGLQAGNRCSQSFRGSIKCSGRSSWGQCPPRISTRSTEGNKLWILSALAVGIHGSALPWRIKTLDCDDKSFSIQSWWSEARTMAVLGCRN